MSAPRATGQPRLREVLASPKMLAILLLGAASGFPNQITESALQAWLKDAGATNITIGVMSYVALPYLLKFLWAPFIDRYPLPLLGRRRGWILAMQVALAATIALFALQNPGVALAPVTACAVAIVFFSATQDIAFDAYRTDVSLPSERGLAAAATNLFGFLDQPVRIVDFRVAEALKYACNAFHATKVSFANEVSRLFRLLGVESREVMSLFCLDQVLNVSPAYLRPGFAFGGSCLPKDLRSLLHLARINGADLPLLAGTLATNELVINEVVDRVVASDARVVALLGLSFKMNTDDLRESPNVELAERLIGKGFDVHIYDPIVNPARLVGSNRRQIESKLPHLGRLLVHEPSQALRGSDVTIVSASDPAVLDALLKSPPRRLIDLNGQLGNEVESLPGYEGLGW